jgi:hypothetical protein
VTDRRSPTFWLVVAILAAVVAFWLALQVLGFLLKLVILIAAVVIAVMAFRSWEASRGT